MTSYLTGITERTDWLRCSDCGSHGPVRDERYPANWRRSIRPVGTALRAFSEAETVWLCPTCSVRVASGGRRR